MAHWLLARLLKHRLPALLVLAALFMISAASLPSLKFDFSIHPLLEGDQELKREVEAFAAAVPPRRADMICTLEWPQIAGRAELAQLKDLSEAILHLSEVQSVFSLAQAEVIEPGSLLPIPMPIDDLLAESTLADVVRAHPLLRGSLLSEDGRSAAIYVGLRPTKDDDVLERGRLQVDQFLNSRPSGDWEVRLLGSPVVQHAISSLMSRDVIRGLLLESILFALLLPLLFRTLRGTLIPLLVILSAVVFSFGALTLLGLHISIIDLAVPGLIMIIALCDAVHMLERFEEGLREGRSRNQAIVEMMKKVGLACFYTSFTTGLGFLSLVAASHPSVRTFGLKAALAVLLTFFTVILLLPLCLAVWPRAGIPSKKTLLLTGRLSYGRPKLTLCLFGLLTVFSILGASRVKVESHWLEELPEKAAAVTDLRWYERNFRPILTLDVRLTGTLAEPEVFRALEHLQREVLKEKEVAGCESYVHWIREVTGRQEEITDEQIAAGAGFLRMAGDRFPGHVVARDFREGRMSFNTEDVGTARFFEIAGRIDRLGAELPLDARAEVAGYMRMAHESSRLVITTILKSFLLSLVAINLFIMLIYRSVRIGLIAVLPNLLPILVTLGMSGLLGIPLRIGIVMIYSVGLGLAVDDSIHLLTRFTQERRADPARSVRETLLFSLRHTGRALIITSLILMIGGLCYLPSDFRSLNDVGLLLSILILTALLADLFLLPLLLEWGTKCRETSRD
ncbi:MAG: MMPL family transporter [Planctomycetota bacterium]